jgi:8-oxo-dGTP pyrophosphatase MutT (NUDIX family)
VVSLTLPHAGDPHRLLWERGYRVVRPLSTWGTLPELTVNVQVCQHDRALPRPSRLPARAVEIGLVADEAVSASQRQRIAAYAIVLAEGKLLATQFSDLTAVPGLWGLPGGGMNDGETPSQTVIREVREETGQELDVSHLLDLQTDHWIGRAPNGVVEDFHAVRIIYAGSCPSPTAAVVHDLGGTTSEAAWIPLGDWGQLPWTQGVRALLERHLPGLADGFGPIPPPAA